MQPTTEPTADPAADSTHGQPAATPMFVCPYCGGATPDQPRCTHCRGFLDPLSRQASQNAMGAWFIRNPDSPHQSGCSYETIVTLVSRGRISLDSVLRSPTTHQFWSPAKRVPGVANLLGLCHSCGCDVEPTDPHCPECHIEFQFQRDRQELGLMPLRALPGGPPVAAQPPAPPPPPPATHTEPSPSLLRHTAALEANVRWLWMWLFAAFAVIGLLSALGAAAYFSGFVSINPNFAPKATRSAAPAPTPAEAETFQAAPPVRPAETPSASPAPATNPSATPPTPASPAAPADPKPTPDAPQDETLAQADALIKQDTVESLTRAIALLEPAAADTSNTNKDKATNLLRTAKARLTQKELSGVR
jgi:hypothetical protein